MNLYIDTTDRISKLKITEKNQILIEKEINSDQILSETLLKTIEDMLSKIRKDKKELTVILVNPGPGSYTGVRIGLTTANLLAFSLNIPISVEKNKLTNFLNPILPIYKEPPFITKQKARL